MSDKRAVKKAVDYGTLGREEVISLMLRMRSGKPRISNEKLAERMNEKYGKDGVKLNKDAIRDLTATAWREERLVSASPPETNLAAKVRQKAEAEIGGRLSDVRVIQTADAAHIADAIAGYVFDWFEQQKQLDELHVGFFGGRTNGLVAKALAIRFAQAETTMGKRAREAKAAVHFHALVGTLDTHDPETNPNSFPLYFAQLREAIEVGFGGRFRYHSFPVTGAVTPTEFATLRGTQAVRHLVDNPPEFDLIICSCGHLDCEYTYTQYLAQGVEGIPALEAACGELVEHLTAANSIGDIGWHPITAAGPMDLAALPLRVATRFDLPYLIEKTGAEKTKVLLGISPCSDPECTCSKREFLDWALRHKPASHIFVDSRSAREYLGLPHSPPTIPTPEPRTPA